MSPVGLKKEKRNRGFKTTEIFKIMIKSNNHLKVLRTETDTEFTVPEGPHKQLIVTDSPGHNS